MIPIGYMAKRVAQRPAWLNVPQVQDIYSVSNCVSANFLDYIKFWRHNGYWLFDHPQIIEELAQENNIALEDLTFFYYEAYEKEFDEETDRWQSFEPSDFLTHIIPPTQKIFHGYDVATCYQGTNLGCSPLSCNHLASEIETNAHCLLESLEEAEQNIESGRFAHSEPGPFRIIAVYTIDRNY